MKRTRVMVMAFWREGSLTEEALQDSLFEQSEDDLWFYFAYRGWGLKKKPERYINIKTLWGWEGHTVAEGIFVGKAKARAMYKKKEILSIEQQQKMSL